jgi:hypothetical protein
MSPVLIGLWAAWGSICGVWAALILAQSRVRREGLLLRPLPGDDEESGVLPSVSVVIPARNEAAALADCLLNVLSQDYPRLSVVVADDRSEDDTAAIADRVAGRDARVRVLRVAKLPRGWMGKSHALWSATRQLTADWLLFLDVDCTLRPQAVRTAIREARRRNIEFLSLWPGQAPGGFWEHLLIPLCAAIIALWFGARKRAAFANGQFLLVTRNAYERMGGHRAVRTALIEDIPLAERAALAGVRPWVGSGRELVAVRMYAGLGAIVDGWTRIYVGALRSSVKIAASILWLLCGSLLPYVMAIWLAAKLVGPTRPADPTTLLVTSGLCVLHLALLLAASWRFWGLGGCKRAYLVLYPASVLVVAAILVRAWWWLTVRRSVPWRERAYTIDARAHIVP